MATSTPDHEKTSDEVFRRVFETLGIESPVYKNMDVLVDKQKQIDYMLLTNARTEEEIKGLRQQIKTRRKEIEKLKKEMKDLSEPKEKIIIN